jgi:anhydro-N-acetylmuramic acid kinase
MKLLESIRSKPVRRVVGLMSGTSADGVDAALVEIEESTGFAGLDLIHTVTVPYPNDLAGMIRDAGSLGVEGISDMNYAVGESFAAAALEVIRGAGIDPSGCDLIGSHGQTLFHRPRGRIGSTLQIGEPAVIAGRTGVVTVSDFRSADIAAGGEGAPLVPLADYYLFRPERGTRLLLNIGGIANLTILTPGKDCVRGFDTGPGNALIDAAVRTLSRSDATFDENGEIARRGVPDEGLLSELLDHPYLDREPPRSTGLEEFGTKYLDTLRAGYPTLSLEDLVCTLTQFTARSIARAIGDFVSTGESDGKVYVGGGGYHNRYLMQLLGKAVHPLRIEGIEKLGIPVDYREAVAFAILANETIEGRPGNLVTVTGAKREVVLGKISLPYGG